MTETLRRLEDFQNFFAGKCCIILAKQHLVINHLVFSHLYTSHMSNLLKTQQLQHWKEARFHVLEPCLK